MTSQWQPISDGLAGKPVCGGYREAGSILPCQGPGRWEHYVTCREGNVCEEHNESWLMQDNGDDPDINYSPSGLIQGLVGPAPCDGNYPGVHIDVDDYCENEPKYVRVVEGVKFYCEWHARAEWLQVLG
jgi:hypothetical protein